VVDPTNARVPEDRFNVDPSASPADVDAANKAFYGRFTYPWPPSTFDAFTDASFWPCMINQDIGAWAHDRVPEDADVWVAGCGTNQAVFTALRMPRARVLGTDLSVESLAAARASASAMGLETLDLAEGSIHEAAFRDRFDYIACTGVIHHNADPAACLRRLAAALKPGGVLELMVYNYFHRLLTTAYQKAVRLISGRRGDVARELAITRRLIETFPVRNLMSGFLEQQRGLPDEGVADALLQPVEYSYTVESLAAMASACGLELLMPCVTAYDKAARRVDWNIRLGDAALDRDYDALPDLERWQIANLLLFNDSPMLWCYLQRADAPMARQGEREVGEAFLDTRFERVSTTVRQYIKDGDRRVAGPERPLPEPAAPPDPAAARLLMRVTPDETVRQTCDALGIDTSARAANRLRIHLTTTAFPYLRAVG
jgi:SAM-dependent methyltransferase